jgi:DNA-binding transcriptional regulator YbjK
MLISRRGRYNRTDDRLTQNVQTSPPSAASVPPPGRRSSPDQVRAAIVDATVRIVGRGGVAAVTHRAVAAEAGVSLSSTTYHFASKGDIVDEALREVARREIAAASQAAAALDALGAAGVTALVEAALAFLCRQVEDEDARVASLAGYHLQLEAAHRPELRDINAEWTAAAEALAAEVLRRAGSPAPETDGKLLAAALDALRKEEIARPRPGVTERLRPAVTRLLEALIRPA